MIWLAHPAERRRALMLVHPGAQVDLRHRGQPVRLEQVDEQPELDSVTGDEWHALQHGAARRVLTGERLHEPGEQRPVQVQQRARDEFGDPAAAVAECPRAGGRSWPSRS